MKWTPRKIIAVSILGLTLIPTVLVYQAAQRLMRDQYADDPKVVALPPDYRPMAAAAPYAGPHPSALPRPVDRYSFPVPIGETGPAVPTYADGLDYPFACRTEAAGLGQPVPDNDDGSGTAVYATDEAGNKTEEIIGYSKDCSIPTQVRYLYRSRKSGEFLPYSSNHDDVDTIVVAGNEVPFVVRLESGTINRYIYMIALLRGPNDTPDSPDLTYWNGKVLYLLRGGIGIGRRQGRSVVESVPDHGHTTNCSKVSPLPRRRAIRRPHTTTSNYRKTRWPA